MVATTRLFVLLLLWAALGPGPALAQEPVTLTGEVTDGVTTQTITLTVYFTPVQISRFEPAYTTTLSTGNDFVLNRSISYGQILAGSGGVILVLGVVFFLVARNTYGRNV